MALKKEDKDLIKAVSKSLRTIEAANSRGSLYADDYIDTPKGREYFPPREPTIVKITKEDLRNQSGRKFIRDSYQKELVDGFNSEFGTSAEIIDSEIYVKSVPAIDPRKVSTNLSSLLSDGKNAQDDLEEQDRDEEES